MDSKDGKRRRYVRCDSHLLVSYRKAGSDEAFDMTQTRDISAGGICILPTQRNYDKDELLELLVTFPFQEERIKVIGKVCHIGCRGTTNKIGVLFTNLPPSLAIELKNYVKRFIEPA